MLFGLGACNEEECRSEDGFEMKRSADGFQLKGLILGPLIRVRYHEVQREIS